MSELRRSPRQLALASARLPVCPRCGSPVHRLTIGHGHLWAKCEGKLRRAGLAGFLLTSTAGPPPPLPAPPPLGERCPAHLLMFGVNDGLAVVVAVTREEFDRYSSSAWTARGLPAIAHELGLLTALLPEK